MPMADKVQIAIETFVSRIKDESKLGKYTERAMRLEIIQESRYWHTPVSIPASSFVKLFFGIRTIDRETFELVMRGASQIDTDKDGGRIETGYFEVEALADAIFVIRIIAAAGNYSPIILAYLDASSRSFLNKLQTSKRLGKPIMTVNDTVERAMRTTRRLLLHLEQGLVARNSIERWINGKKRPFDGGQQGR